MTNLKEPNSKMDSLLNTSRMWYKKTVRPFGRAYYVWLAVVSLAVIYNLVAVIARFSFIPLQNEYPVVWVVLDCLCDAIYAIDVQIKLRTAYFADGMLVEDVACIVENYAKSRAFLLDVFSILPADILLYKRMENTTFLRFNRIFRIGRMVEFFTRIEHFVKRPQLCRILNLVFYILIILHWNACFYILISDWIGFGSDDWVYFNITDPQFPENGSLSRMYIYSFYWSTLTLSTIGDMAVPVKNAEFIFMICNFLIGVLVFATIVGHVNDMLHSFASDEEEFRSKLDGVKYYMMNKNVGETVQTYLVEWFEYLWQTNKSLHLESKLEYLPERLQAKIKLDALRHSLRTSIFRNCDSRFLEEFALRLRHDVFSPGEYICRKGDIGREMYLIAKGCMKVKLNGITRQITTGAIFGEISLLDIPENVDSDRRTADVWSIGYTDVFIMTKDDLDRLLKEFPDVCETLTQKARLKLKFGGKLRKTKEVSNETIVTTCSVCRARANTNAGVTFTKLKEKVDHIAVSVGKMGEFNERLEKVEETVMALNEKLDILISKIH